MSQPTTLRRPQDTGTQTSFWFCFLHMKWSEYGDTCLVFLLNLGPPVKKAAHRVTVCSLKLISSYDPTVPFTSLEHSSLSLLSPWSVSYLYDTPKPSAAGRCIYPYPQSCPKCPGNPIKQSRAKVSCFCSLFSSDDDHCSRHLIFFVCLFQNYHHHHHFVQKAF